MTQDVRESLTAWGSVTAFALFTWLFLHFMRDVVIPAWLERTLQAVWLASVAAGLARWLWQRRRARRAGKA